MQIPAGYANVSFYAKIGGQAHTAETSIGYNLEAWTPTDIDAIYDAWATFGGAAGWPSTVQIKGVQVTVGTADPTAPLVYDYEDVVTGSGSANLCPPNTTFLVKKFTLLGGRKGRGRMFIPFVGESLVDNSGVLTSGTAGAINDALDDLITAVDAVIGGTPHLLHSDATDPTEITGFACAASVATQRRRLVRS